MIAHTRPLLIALLLLAPLGAVGVSAYEVSDDPLAAYPPGSRLMPDGSIAVPLGLPTPEEYTPEIHEKVLLAGEKGMGYDAVNDREVAFATNFLFIRPGAWMWSPSWCTMNFIYGTPGKYQIGSAGHCNAVGTEVVIVAYPGVFARIGKTVVSRDNGPGDDYSFADIYPAFQGNVDANVADIGGPQNGAYTGTASLTRPLAAKQFGHGLGIGTGGTPRVGAATAISGSIVYFDLPVVFGDSGSPMLGVTTASPNGQALAVVTHLSVGALTYTGLGTRIASISNAVVNGDGNFLPPA